MEGKVLDIGQRKRPPQVLYLKGFQQKFRRTGRRYNLSVISKCLESMKVYVQEKVRNPWMSVQANCKNNRIWFW